MSEYPTTFAKLVSTVIQCRKFVLWSFIGSFGICLMTLLLLPKQYTARITFLPVMVVDSARMDSIPNTAFVLSNLGAHFTERAFSILSSRTIKEAIIKKFELTKIYETDTIIEAVETLNGLTKIEHLQDGPISVEVSDRSPHRAADIANEYGNQLYHAKAKYQLIPLKILDRAVPPVRPSKPKKGIIICEITFLTFFLNLIVLYAHYFIMDLKEQCPAEYEKLRFIQMTLKSDVLHLCFWLGNNHKQNGCENTYFDNRNRISWRNTKMLEPAPED